ncbi:MAG: YeeE/YedE family protein [Desulfobulbaceae bacterium]|nr:YeeE/YedE family protein [Desulfobulbaceae bacterium]
MTPAILFIIIVNLALGLVAGAIMYRSDFCVAGMFRDLFLFRKTVMLRTLLLLVVASMVLFELMRRIGLLPLYPFPLLGSPSLGNIAGGVIFGIGMVLAGGCVVGTLYKMGGGSMISATAFAGLIIGSGLYAEMHPWWTAVSKKFSFLQGHITLPQALGCDPILLLLPVTGLAAYLFLRWHAQRRWEVASPAEGYIQPWKAALYLAILGTLSYTLIGMPFGITNAYAKAASYLTNIPVPMHVSQVAFYNTVPLKYTAPVSQVELHGGPGPFFDAIAYIQFPLIAGIVLGAMIAALRIGEFRVYFRVPARQYVSALAGGIILALGSRMTPGCNIWHLFGGVPILSMQSLLFLIGIIPGSYIGSRLLVTLVLSMRPEVSA